MMVIFLVGLVSMILMRTLRKDYARYSKDEDIDDMVSKCQTILLCNLQRFILLRFSTHTVSYLLYNSNNCYAIKHFHFNFFSGDISVITFVSELRLFVSGLLKRLPKI